jgi:hypothetical protein
MFSLPLLDRIASAHAVFCGPHGAVSRLARDRAVRRQTLYRQAHALARDADPDRPAPEVDSLRRQVAELQAECDRLRRLLSRACVLDDDKRAAFAATAQALGVSLSAARALLAVGLGQAAPSVAQLGRLSRRAGRRATEALAVLDEFSRPRAKQVAADEIFVGRKPVLMTVEQHSLCWLGGRLAPSRDGREWHKEFQRLPAAEQVARDGGQGLEKGLQLTNAQRRQAGQAEVADQEDHFHILHRARRALREVRAKAVRAYRQAEKAQAAMQRARRKKKLPGGVASHAYQLWRKAEAAFDRWSAQEKAYERLRAGLRLFASDGRLNTPAAAEAEVRAALAQLDGPEWSRVRTKLVGAKAFTFLARAQEQLAALPVAEELRQAAVRAEELRRQAEALRGEEPRAGALRGVALACGLVLSLSGEAGTQALALVRGVLNGAWRSSSLVEGLNSVLRMQQRRQKRLTQGLLDLKRLYWNAHVFVAGRRKKKSPYERLGLVLPPGGWWQLLKQPPEQLRQQLSALNPAA